MSKIIYSAGLFTGTLKDGVLSIIDPKGTTILNADHDINTSGEWTEEASNAFIASEVDVRNTMIVKSLVESKLSELTDVYNTAMTSNVTLSDGSVFGASKQANSDFKNLQNTVDLINSGCKFATYMKAESIVLSDAFNNDVEYNFDYESENPIYILPIVEIAKYIATYFTAKRLIRNRINSYLTKETINLDELLDIDISTEFKNIVKVAISGK